MIDWLIKLFFPEDPEESQSRGYLWGD